MWRLALEKRPDQYIWMRRIQQYGPPLSKPYPFYDWIERARRDLRARGEEPPPLRVALTGSEKLGRGEFVPVAAEKEENPDPRGLVPRDTRGVAAVEAVIVPSVGRGRTDHRLHVEMALTAGGRVHWNNEAGPAIVWIDTPASVRATRRLVELPFPDRPVSSERRRAEIDLRVREGSERNDLVVKGFVLYGICDDATGVCTRLRRDFEVRIPADR